MVFGALAAVERSVADSLYADVCIFPQWCILAGGDSLSRVSDITGLKLVLVIIYLPIAVSIVRRARQWRQDNLL